MDMDVSFSKKNSASMKELHKNVRLKNLIQNL